MRRIVLLVVVVLTGCTGLPKGVTPIGNFELDRYLGTWYEIARLDHSFERGLSRVSAEYTLRPDGGVVVQNQGYSEANGEFEDATGKAYFVGEPATGHLKVSFFGPFYGSYVIFRLDPQYQYAFVSGFNKKNLWLLSRTPEVSEDLITRFRNEAESLGFDLSDLILVDQSVL